MKRTKQNQQKIHWNCGTKSQLLQKTDGIYRQVGSFVYDDKLSRTLEVESSGYLRRFYFWDLQCSSDFAETPDAFIRRFHSVAQGVTPLQDRILRFISNHFNCYCYSYQYHHSYALKVIT